MPILAGLFTSFFASLASFFGQFMAKRFALGMAALAVMATVTTGFYATCSALLNGVSAALPSWPGMEIAVWVAAPEILPVAVSACIAADVAVALYQWNQKQLKFLML